MLRSAVSVLVVAQSSSEIPEGLMNNPVYKTVNELENFLHTVKYEYKKTLENCAETVNVLRLRNTDY